MSNRILIIDDEPDVLDVLENVLIEEGYDVTKALGGKAAIELLENRSFDLVITDLKMPQIDGIGVMKRIRQLKKDLEIIVLTGFASVKTAVEAMRDYRVFDYLTKPFDQVDEIIIVAEKAMERRNLLKEKKNLLAKLQTANAELEKRVIERTTALDTANKQLKEARIAAEIASRAKTDFLATMSHELRTPLNHIIGFCELLMSNIYGELNEKQQSSLGNVLKSGQRLYELINDILEFTNAIDGNLEMIHSEISLDRVLKKSIDMIREKADNKKLTLTTTIGEIPDIISADEYMLRQILYNLLSNAIKFTPEGGRVILTARMAGKDAGSGTDALLISIADTGIGLNPENLTRIFEPFFQVEETFTRRYEGAGLGLALAEKMVAAHGGKIWAQSNGLDRGSCFYFTLPV